MQDKERKNIKLEKANKIVNFGEKSQAKLVKSLLFWGPLFFVSYLLLHIFVFEPFPYVYIFSFLTIADISLLILFKKKVVSLKLARNIIILTTVISTNILFYLGGAYYTGIFWILVIPLFLFFFLGTKKGLIYSLISFTFPIVIHFFLKPNYNYNSTFILIFLSTYLAITMFTLFYTLIIEILIKKLNRAYKKTKTANYKLMSSNKKLKISKEKLVESNMYKNKIFSILSHDLKNSIGSIKNLLYLFQEGDKDIPYSDIKLSVDSVYSILETLLEWSKIQLKKETIIIKDFYIDELIEKIIKDLQQLADQKKNKIEKNLKHLKIKADERTIEIVIKNLISNAIKFSYHGGIIKVETIDNQENVEIIVEDYGIGINEDIEKSLRDKKQIKIREGTNKELGTGLGLSLSYELLLKNNSILRAERKTQGSRFYFLIPKSQTI
ncbi:MAG TPA: HAMP domain-containing sensor histidine kinase [Spirochaetota bacterium]|nr:HAMP domain-containing sensor histidine kinase [Spirochaetota bacterium]HOM38391.1 HAMP domain-containing sensor histidine kinase [Spirochaetota bacterium]HPQ48391.1 HAMP domain-containing sensor histidine kinase [Spirochaetota bacterium]